MCADQQTAQRAKILRGGRYFEDFSIGDLYHHWPGRTISQSDYRLYCLITLNYHLDSITIHPGYIYSLLLGLSMSDLSRNAIRHEELNILIGEQGMRCGDTLYAETEVLSRQSTPDDSRGGVVTLETRGFNQAGAPVMSYQRRLTVRKAPEE